MPINNEYDMLFKCLNCVLVINVVLKVLRVFSLAKQSQHYHTNINNEYNRYLIRSCEVCFRLFLLVDSSLEL